MLPNRPNRPTGLPTAPRARSVGRSREENVLMDNRRGQTSQHPRSSSIRQVRPQRSLASIPIVQDRQQPMPSVPEARQAFRPLNTPRGYERPVYDTHNKQYSDTSSISSSGSSLLDRMRGRSGDTSSQTSVDEEYDEPVKRGRQTDAQTISGWKLQEEPRSYTEESELGNGEGYNIWSRVATAASTLTVSVSKAWHSNVPIYTGEETPAGQESRLTRAMKAYHLEKARDPLDLPEWLFEEHERRPVGRHRLDDPRDLDEQYDHPPPRKRGLRDIYDAAGVNAVPMRSEQPAPAASRRRYTEDAGPSKATDRLKALRDAKRNVHTGSRYDDQSVHPSSAPSAPSGYDVRSQATDSPAIRHPVDGDRRPPPRVGLPSGPGVRPNRF